MPMWLQVIVIVEIVALVVAVSLFIGMKVAHARKHHA
jgi:hypothetical protein